VKVEGRDVLVIPYTLDNNDMKFAVPPGFGDPGGFERHLSDAFDLLLEEGRAGAPKMMSVGLHCRLVGRPGRARALQRFLAHVASHRDEVWVCRRADIARHWRREHPAP
jgi:peptidoglycan/xylan/chitin deacetylase (PgdA/CDA1 family)